MSKRSKSGGVSYSVASSTAGLSTASVMVGLGASRSSARDALPFGDADARSFGAVMRELRSGRQLTQTALAERLHVSGSLISLLESDQRAPSRALIDALAETLGLARDSDQRHELLRLGGFAPHEIADSIERLVDSIAEVANLGESAKLLVRCDLSALSAGWTEYFGIRKLFDQGAIMDALAGYERALTRKHYSPALRAWLRIGLAETLVQHGDLTHAAATIYKAHQNAEELQPEPEWSPTLGAEARAIQGLVAAHNGRFAMARTLIEQAINTYERLIIARRVPPDASYLGIGANYKRLAQVALMQDDANGALTLALTSEAYLNQASDSVERRHWLHRTGEMMAWAYSKLKEFSLARQMRTKTQKEMAKENDVYGVARNIFYIGDDCVAEIKLHVDAALAQVETPLANVANEVSQPNSAAPHAKHAGGADSITAKAALQRIIARNEAICAALQAPTVSELLDQAEKCYRTALETFEQSGQDAMLGRTLANLGLVLRYQRLRDHNRQAFVEAQRLLIQALTHEARVGHRGRLPVIYETLANLWADEYISSQKADDLVRAREFYRSGLKASASAQGQQGQQAQQAAESAQRMDAMLNLLSPLKRDGYSASRALEDEQRRNDPVARWRTLCNELVATAVQGARGPRDTPVAPIAFSTADDAWVRCLLTFDEQAAPPIETLETPAEGEARGRILLQNRLSYALSEKTQPGLSSAGALHHAKRYLVFREGVKRVRCDEEIRRDLCCRTSVESDFRSPLATLASLAHDQAVGANDLLTNYSKGYLLESAPFEFPLAFAVSGARTLIEAPVGLAPLFIGATTEPLRVGTTICMEFTDQALADELHRLFQAFITLSAQLAAERPGIVTTSVWLSDLIKSADITAHVAAPQSALA